MSGTTHRHLFATLAVVLAGALVGGACSDDGDSAESADGDTTTTAGERTVDDLRLNEIQMIGSHNSYKQKPRDEVAAALEGLLPDLFAEIDYGHLPLGEQLAAHGVRQFEIDVLADLVAIQRQLERAKVGCLGEPEAKAAARLGHNE